MIESSVKLFQDEEAVLISKHIKEILNKQGLYIEYIKENAQEKVRQYLKSHCILSLNDSSDVDKQKNEIRGSMIDKIIRLINTKEFDEVKNYHELEFFLSKYKLYNKPEKYNLTIVDEIIFQRNCKI